MHGLLRCNINAGVHARALAQSGRVTQRCHNCPDGKRGLRGPWWRHTPEERGGFWEILKKLGSWDETCLGGRRFSLARGDLFAGCHTCWVGGWKSQNRKIVPLSPYVEEPLNSKVIKVLYLNKKVVTCFSCFEIPMFYLYGHSMYVSHIAISWLRYTELCLYSKPFTGPPTFLTLLISFKW